MSDVSAHVKRGFFITLEGGEGAGKSTQSTRLATRLRGFGLDVRQTREPGGSPRAEELRKVLLSGQVAALGPVAEALLFSAARIDHLDKTIRPALEGGITMICDRFADSTRAYQGTLGNVDARLIRALERVAVGNTRPDLTLILDVPAEVGLARAAQRRTGTIDRFEAEDLSFHQALRNSFLDIAAAEPWRCCVIDGARPADDVAESIWHAVEDRLLAVTHPDAPPLASASAPAR